MITRDGPLWMVILAVTSGAAMGAMIRWTLTYLFNEKSWFFTARRKRTPRSYLNEYPV
jgi:hypothetical protein